MPAEPTPAIAEPPKPPTLASVAPMQAADWNSHNNAARAKACVQFLRLFGLISAKTAEDIMADIADQTKDSVSD